MANWYLKGQSNYNNATGFHMGFYMDMNGFASGLYDTRKMPDHVEKGDPFMAFAAKTKIWTPASQQVEWGLWNHNRVRVDASGVWGWNESSGIWQSLYGGGAGDSFWVAGLTGCTGSGIIGYDGYVYATRVYNAVYNDYADYWRRIPRTRKIPGRCYSFTKKGLKLTDMRADPACVGICSDTYGHAVGNLQNGIPISIGGFLLADVDKEYNTGKLLVPNISGVLTEATDEEIIMQKSVAKYLYKETKTKTKGVWVNDRHWVKVI